MRTNRKQHRKPRMENLDSRCLMTASALAELSHEPVADDLPAEDPWAERAAVGQQDRGGMVMELDDDWCGTGPKIDIPLPGPIGPALGAGFDYYPNPEDDGDFGPAGPVVKEGLDQVLGNLGMVMELDDDWCGTGPKIDIPLPGPIGPTLGVGFDYYPNPEDDDDFGPAGPVVKDAISTALKELEAEDKLGNFEIQDLMSRFNQSETLSSSIANKLGNTAKGAIQRVG